MNKYIPADKLIAEISRLKEETPKNGRYEVLNHLLSTITSLQQEPPALPGIEDPGIPGKDFIPVEWVDACEMYGKWKIVKQEQPEVPNLDEAAQQDAIRSYAMPEDGNIDKVFKVQEARIFHEIGFKAGSEWMAGQGVSMPGKVGIYGVDVESITEELQKAGFKLGEEVVLQIRKRQQPYGRMAKLSGRNE